MLMAGASRKRGKFFRSGGQRTNRRRVVPSNRFLTRKVPHAWFAPEYDWTGVPGMSNLDSTINGVAIAPTIRVAADGSGGLTEDGTTWTLTGSGDAPVDNPAVYGYGASDAGTRYRGGQYHTDGDVSRGNLTTGDCFAELLFTYADENAGVVGKLHYTPSGGGQYTGWEAVSVTGGNLYLFFGDGTTLESLVVSGLVAGETYYVSWGRNADEATTSGGRAFVNGTIKDSKDLSGLGSLATGLVPTAIGSRQTGLGTTLSTSSVQHFALYEQANLWSAGATGAAEMLAEHRRRFAQLTGQYLAKAKGTRAATTLASRSGHAFLRKEDATLGTLWVPVGDDVPTIEHDSDGVLCYAPIASQTAGPAYNGDLGNAAWVKRGSASVASDTGADGRTCDCRIMVGGHGGSDIYSVTTPPGGCTTADYIICVKAKSGDTGTLCIGNPYGPSGNRDEIDLSALPANKWVAITPSSPYVSQGGTGWGVVSGYASFIFFAASGSVTCNVDYPTAVKDSTAVRPILTTTTSRTTGAETSGLVADAANVPAEGRLTLDMSLASGSRSPSLSDGTANERITIVESSGVLRLVANGSPTTTAIETIPGAATGTRYTLVVEYTSAGVRTRVAGGTWTSTLARTPACDRLSLSGGLDGSYEGCTVYSARVEAL